RRHEGPHAATGRHEPRGLEVPVRARDRPRRDAEVVRERAHGRQPLTVREVARRDEGRDLRPELLVVRGGGVEVDADGEAPASASSATRAPAARGAGSRAGHTRATSATRTTPHATASSTFPAST